MVASQKRRATKSMPVSPDTTMTGRARTRGKALPLDADPADHSVPDGSFTQPRVAHGLNAMAQPNDSAAEAAASDAANTNDVPVRDDVGYKKPPKTHQFKKGQSGNPKGRVKGSRNLAAIVEEVTSERIAVRENGRVVKLSKLEIAIRQLMADAARGKPRAVDQLIRLLKETGLALPPEKPSALAANDNDEALNSRESEILDDYFNRRLAELPLPAADHPSSPVAKAPEPAPDIPDLAGTTELHEADNAPEVPETIEEPNDGDEPIKEERRRVTLAEQIRQYGPMKERTFRKIIDD